MSNPMGLHIPIELEIDVGPAVQDELAAAGLAPQRQVPEMEHPSAPPEVRLPRDDSALAQMLVGAERLSPRQLSTPDDLTDAISATGSPGPPDPTTEPYFVGHFQPGMPIYGCPGCGFRERSPESVMWHLRAHPTHEPGGRS